METVTISSKIKIKNKTELYQTLESLQPSIRSHCKELQLKINPDNSLFIEITFESYENFKNNFYNNEFNILRGTIKSLCEDVRIKINDTAINNISS